MMRLDNTQGAHTTGVTDYVENIKKCMGTLKRYVCLCWKYAEMYDTIEKSYYRKLISSNDYVKAQNKR